METQLKVEIILRRTSETLEIFRKGTKIPHFVCSVRCAVKSDEKSQKFHDGETIKYWWFFVTLGENGQTSPPYLIPESVMLTNEDRLWEFFWFTTYITTFAVVNIVVAYPLFDIMGKFAFVIPLPVSVLVLIGVARIKQLYLERVASKDAYHEDAYQDVAGG